MSPNRKRFRKRGHGTAGGTSFSKSLRTARDLNHKGKTADGLALLNQLSKESKQPGRRARIALQIGLSEAGHSRHNEAATAFGRAGQLARQSGDATLALQAGIAEVRALLRSLQTDQAKNTAALILEDLRKELQRFDSIANLSPAELERQGPVTLPPRPPRLSVALTGIAVAFVESGETEEARIFLDRAIALSPNGASRARQLAARLALAADQPEKAETLAREALLMGRYQAKTVAAWQLYLDARARQNRSPILEPVVFEGLTTHAKGRVLSASLLSVIRVLRGHGDETWKSIARATLASPLRADSVILTEIEKILHADAKLTLSESPEVIAARSLKLFKANDVSSFEQIAHAKSYVRHALVSGKVPDLPRLIKIAGDRFGARHVLAIRHTAALGAMMAQRHDLAREWFGELVGDTMAGSVSWGKAAWALARMESSFEDRFSEAAFWYLEIAAKEKTPPRFRIQAMLRGFKFLGKSGNPVNSPEVSATIRSILAVTDDWRLLLDAARQLTLAGAGFIDLRGEASRKGCELARLAINNSSSAKARLEIHEYLARRLAWDLGNYHLIIQIWDSLSPSDKGEFQLAGGSLWFDYLALIFRSLNEIDRVDEAKNLVSNILDRDVATSEGYVILGTEYALWLMRSGQIDKAYEYYDWISKEAPTHRRSAAAYYWIALRDLKSADKNGAIRAASAIKKCFGGSPSLLEEWEYDAFATIILNDFDLDLSFKSSGGLYQPKFLNSVLALMERRLRDI